MASTATSGSPGGLQELVTSDSHSSLEALHELPGPDQSDGRGSDLLPRRQLPSGHREGLEPRQEGSLDRRRPPQPESGLGGRRLDGHGPVRTDRFSSFPLSSPGCVPVLVCERTMHADSFLFVAEGRASGDDYRSDRQGVLRFCRRGPREEYSERDFHAPTIDRESGQVDAVDERDEAG
ncbi:hypothetical protein BJY59DRAFT_34512 [Rhodotorula toruloides]